MNQEKSTKLRLVAKTNTGMVRELNEDNFIATENILNQNWIIPQKPFLNNSNGTMLVVTDGMGGTNAGEVASRITVDSIKEYFKSLKESLNTSSINRHLKNGIIVAHKNIIAHGKVNPETEGMGATVVIAAIVESKLFYSWSGDSRCYLFSKGKLKQLTKDHSYVQSLVDKGKITKEQAFFHPENNIITQNLGDKERLPEPEFGNSNLSNGDLILLCSDGLSSMLKEEEIENIISANANDLNNCTDKLIESANEAGGNDNISVVMAGVGDIEKNILFMKKSSDQNSKHTDTIATQNNALSNKKKSVLLISTCIVLLAVLFLFFKRTNKENNSIQPVIQKDTLINEKKQTKAESEKKTYEKEKNDNEPRSVIKKENKVINQAIKEVDKAIRETNNENKLNPVKPKENNDQGNNIKLPDELKPENLKEIHDSIKNADSTNSDKSDNNK